MTIPPRTPCWLSLLGPDGGEVTPRLAVPSWTCRDSATCVNGPPDLEYPPLDKTVEVRGWALFTNSRGGTLVGSGTFASIVFAAGSAPRIFSDGAGLHLFLEAGQ
jgi:hypothetical protein